MAHPVLGLLPVWMVIVLAAQATRRRHDEEEEISMEGRHDSDFEFKIVQSVTGAFRKLETLRQMLAEEAVAGWELHEKLDDNRVRLRRPTARRVNDSANGMNPYRTVYGPGMAWLVVLILGGLLVLMLAGFWLSVIFG